ncbi:anthranilate phosphoribosyltransferase [Priestia koreensis]|uniref:Glycosyl transferase n=1 Tax=Priestia koreensis TaxID=284581 RepID=A0A0M0L9A6_9BACI|nr:glycosyl transferase [Priestia koreensis]KOO47614.1 glycosyl transferase [Priestia koreensis]
MQQWIKEVARGKRGAHDLTYEQAKEAAAAIVSGASSDIQTTAFFIGQRIKTESAEELQAFVEAYSEATEKVPLTEALREKAIDFAGPYAGRNSFLATLSVSLLLAARGIPAFLHSSDALPPKYGTTIKALLHTLGVSVTRTPEEEGAVLEELKIGFVDTERYSEALHRARMMRTEIGVRTVLNTVEKLLNVSGSRSIMLGAFHRTAINKMLPIFSSMNYSHAYIVQGIEGSEDVPVHRNSFVFHVTNGVADSFIVQPRDYELSVEEESFPKQLTLEEQVNITRSILKGDQTSALLPHYNQVVLNAGLRYYLFGYEKSIEEGIQYAKNQLKSGIGYTQLEKWKEWR